MFGTSMTDPNKSIAVWDLAPDGGTAPNQFQATSGRALELIDAFPGRYRIALPGDVQPSVRSDGKPIIPDADQ
jgi:hypothetical protein